MVCWLYRRSLEPTVAVYQVEIRQDQGQGHARDCRSEHAGPQGRLGVLREHRHVRQLVHRRAGQAAAGRLSPHHRQPGDGDGHRRRGPKGGAAGLLRQLPDHAGQRHPASARPLQAPRRDDRAGRGRDRRGVHGHRGGVLPERSRSRRPAARGSTSSRKHSAWRSPPRCRWSSSTCSAAGRAPACRPRRSRPTCSLLCTAGTARCPLPIVAASHPVRLLLLRLRGLPHRRQVSHARHLPLRRLPRQRRRAVAHPGGEGPCRRSTRPSWSRPTAAVRSPAIPIRWPGRGSGSARRGSNTASAASRKTRAPATSATTRTITRR